MEKFRHLRTIVLILILGCGLIFSQLAGPSPLLADTEGHEGRALISNMNSAIRLTDEGTVIWWGRTYSTSPYQPGVRGEPFEPIEITFPEKVLGILGNPECLTFFARLENGEIWAWGNNDYGVLPGIQGSYLPYPMKLDVPEDVTDLAHSRERLYLLHEDGAVSTCGYDGPRDPNGGHIAPYDPENSKLYPLNFGENTRGVKVDCGEDFVAVLTEDSQVWIQGTVYEIGTPQNPKSPDHDQPQSIDYPEPGRVSFPEPIVDIACQNSACYALGESGTLYLYGLDYAKTVIAEGEYTEEMEEAASEPFRPVVSWEPEPVTELPEAVKSVRCDGTSVVVQLRNGIFYRWGSNDSRFIDDSDELVIPEPQILELPEEIRDYSVARGKGLALAEDGTYYAWGGIGSGIVPGETPEPGAEPVAFDIELIYDIPFGITGAPDDGGGPGG